MSFGQNLQFFRKNAGITQEELAERLEVSRQSVSKWESDTSFPEMDKIIQLCDMFDCKIDTLIKGNAEEEFAEDSAGYDKHMTKFAKLNTLAVGLVLASLVFSSAADALNFDESLLGMGFMLFILLAVIIFIVNGMKHSNFCRDNPYIAPFYKPEQIKSFESKMPVRMAIGIGIIIFGLILTTGINGMKDSMLKEALENSAFLLCVAVGTPIIVYNGMLKDKYDIEKYNNQNSGEKEKSKSSKWYGIIMVVATMCFFVMGFIDGGLWKYSWISFVVGGFLCAIIAIADNGKKE